MIDSLELVISSTLVAAIPALATKIGFQPPDDKWRQTVDGDIGLFLNCALVDLREDRAHRSNAVWIERDPMRRVHAPFLLRCHYLLSAWNSAKGIDRSLAASQEHALLGRVAATLVQQAPLTPAAVLAPAALAGIPANWRDASFDTDVLPPEGFAKLPEFWGTMGRNAPWRPVVWLAVTVPIAPEPEPIDGIVTTIITSVGQPIPSDEVETLLTVGGHARDVAGVGLAGAIVAITDTVGRLRARVTTGADGGFVVDSLPAGTYDVAASTTSPARAGAVTVTLPAPVDTPVDLILT
jgi:hypothetical protein